VAPKSDEASDSEASEARSDEAAAPATVHCEAATAPLTGSLNVTTTSVALTVRAVNVGDAASSLVAVRGVVATALPAASARPEAGSETVCATPAGASAASVSVSALAAVS